jgi:hypothetical protein
MLELSKPSPEREEILGANDFSLMDNLMLRIQRSAAANYYRAARTGEQVAAGAVPEKYASKITSQTVSVSDPGDLGRDQRRTSARRWSTR